MCRNKRADPDPLLLLARPPGPICDLVTLKFDLEEFRLKKSDARCRYKSIGPHEDSARSYRACRRFVHLLPSRPARAGNLD
jgi:hypothetical protein